MNATDQTDPPPSVTREAWADLIALEPSRPPPVRGRPAYRRLLEQAALFIAPVALAWMLVMYLLPAQYISETSFILRQQPVPLSLPSSGADLTGTPSETGSADSYAVRDFLLSRDAMNASGGVFRGDGNDARFADFSARVAVDYETSSGVITMRAAAPEARQARDLALGLRNAARQLVAGFDRASAASEYVAPLAEPNLPDSPTRQDQPLVLLGAAALGLALAWGRRA
jgi:capsule polysaccharide export protein KpsE/RkpR